MAEPCARLDFSGSVPGFRPVAMEPGVPLADRTGANAKVVHRWLGALAAQPYWDGDNLAFRLVDQRGVPRRHACRPVTAPRLQGPLRGQFEQLQQALRSARPASHTEGLIHETLSGTLRGLAAAADPGWALLEHRDAKGRPRLVWCWGHQRVEPRGTATLCRNGRCRLWFVRLPGGGVRCPGCGRRAVPRAIPWRATAVLALLLLLVGGGTWCWWNYWPTAVFSGRVVAADSHRKPVPNAEVQLAGTDYRAVTDAQGRFSIRGLPAKTFHVEVQAERFDPATIEVQTVARQEMSREIALRGGAFPFGHVRDFFTRKPIAGAEVSAEGARPAVVGPEGQFRLAGIDRAGTLRVSAEGYRPQEVAWPGGVKPLEVFLKGDCTFQGKVLRESDGKPIAGAKVRDRQRGCETLTDAAGAFAIAELPGGSAQFDVSAAGFAEKREDVELRGESVTRDIKLRGAAVVTGAVQNALSGEPLAGATVAVEGAPLAIQSEASGRFQLEGVPAGPARINVSAPGFVSRQLAPDVAIGPATDLGTIKLVQEATLVVRVTDAADPQTPLAGVEVKLTGTDRKAEPSQNAYRLANLHPGAIQLDVTAPGYRPEHVAREVPSGVTELAVSLGGAAEVAGTVIDAADKRPIAGATVRMTQGPRKKETRSDAQGRFQFGRLPAAAVQLDAAAENYASGQVSPQLAAGANDIAIPLSAETELTVHAVDAKTGEPVAEAEIRVAGVAEPRKADAKGIAVFSKVRAGRIALSGSAASYADSRAEADAPPAHARVRLPMSRGYVLRGQVVNALDNQPVPGARVEAVVDGVTVAGTTGADGNYEVKGVTAGEAALKVSAPHFNSQELKKSVPRESGEPIRVVLNPELAKGEMRVVLTWGKTPRDLDLHMVGPPQEGRPLHVYHARRTGGPAKLDVDCKEGEGPETFTIKDAPAGQYRIVVEDSAHVGTAGDKALAASGAEVKVYYFGGKEPKTFRAKEVSGPPGPVWHACEIQVQGDGGVKLDAGGKFSTATE